MDGAVDTYYMLPGLGSASLLPRLLFWFFFARWGWSWPGFYVTDRQAGELIESHVEPLCCDGGDVMFF